MLIFVLIKNLFYICSMKTIEINTTQYWTNKRSGLVWSVQKSEDDIIIFRHNKTKIISIENLLKNYIQK